jgi:rod shape-determining protein MreC
MLWHILWKNKNTFSLTFTIGFSLMGILWQANPFSQALNFFGRVSDQLSGTINSSMRLPQFLWIKVETYRDLESQYQSAIAQLETYKLEKDRFNQLESENKKLRSFMEFPANPDYPEVRAEILGVRINSINPRIMINKGSNHGIKPNMPVIVKSFNKNKEVIRAIAGIVAKVDRTTSIIQPLNHPSFRLGVILTQSNQWAILNGNAGRFNEVLLSYMADDPDPEKAIHSGAAMEIKSGQEVVTSGAGGIFPPGLPVGYVLREGERDGEFKTAYVRTYADITKLSHVIVLQKNPEPWSAEWDSDFSWDEHLQTEFGPPRFPESTQVKKRVSPTTETKKEEKSEDPALQTDEKKSEPAAGPRRIRNVTAPGAGVN